MFQMGFFCEFCVSKWYFTRNPDFQRLCAKVYMLNSIIILFLKNVYKMYVNFFQFSIQNPNISLKKSILSFNSFKYDIFFKSQTHIRLYSSKDKFLFFFFEKFSNMKKKFLFLTIYFTIYSYQFVNFFLFIKFTILKKIQSGVKES